MFVAWIFSVFRTAQSISTILSPTTSQSLPIRSKKSASRQRHHARRRGETATAANKVDDDEDACGNAIIKNNSEDDVQSDGGVRVIAEISDEKTRFQDLETNNRLC